MNLSLSRRGRASSGHGEHGDVISHFVMHELQRCLTAHPALVEDPSRALREAYLKVDERLAEVKVRMSLVHVIG